MNRHDVARRNSRAAEQLFKAEAKRSQIDILSLAHPDMDMDDAYAIQSALVDHKQASGRSIIGWKIGLTSKAMQYALNIDIPDSGILFDDMAFENGAHVPAGRFIQPRVEAEIAFVMSDDIAGAEVSGQDIIAATDYVAPSLEILDTRIKRIDQQREKHALCLIPSPIMPQMPEWYWAQKNITLLILICAGLVPLFIVTAKLRKQAWVQVS